MSEKNTVNKCVEENTYSLHYSTEEETTESGNQWDWLEHSDSDSNSDSDFKP